MNPFTESTVARPLSEAPGNAANDQLINGHQAAQNGPAQQSTAPGQIQQSTAPGQTPQSAAPQHVAPRHGAREGRMPLRHPRSARLARRRARGKEAASQQAASWRAYGGKAAGAVLGFLLALASPSAWAVDVNSATAQQLETITGIGPKTAQVIIDERTRGGSFESFDDLAERVKGIGPKKAHSLQAAGLTMGQAGAAPKSAAPAARKPGK